MKRILAALAAALVSISAAALTPAPAQLTVTKSGNGTGTVTSPAGEISCGTTCATVLPVGTSVTLTAVAQPGSVFAGWNGGNCSGTGACTVQVGAVAAVEAWFFQSFPNGFVGAVVPQSLQFGGQSIGTTSAPMPVTITNIGGNPFSVDAFLTPPRAFG